MSGSGHGPRWIPVPTNLHKTMFSFTLADGEVKSPGVAFGRNEHLHVVVSVTWLQITCLDDVTGCNNQINIIRVLGAILLRVWMIEIFVCTVSMPAWWMFYRSKTKTCNRTDSSHTHWTCLCDYNRQSWRSVAPDKKGPAHAHINAVSKLKQIQGLFSGWSGRIAWQSAVFVISNPLRAVQSPGSVNANMLPAWTHARTTLCFATLALVSYYFLIIQRDHRPMLRAPDAATSGVFAGTWQVCVPGGAKHSTSVNSVRFQAALVLGPLTGSDASSGGWTCSQSLLLYSTVPARLDLVPEQPSG